ncbi:MAG: hypothetical protein EPO40_18720 [Myxococcaceae bacterium]|nr:MAG: hypothetical protein EPO40_18720 [Myxococcaceae bacterium]
MDTDKDGVVTDEFEIRVTQSDGQWEGVVDVEGTDVDGVAVLWKVRATAAGPFTLSGVLADSGKEVISRIGELAEGKQRLIEFCDDP